MSFFISYAGNREDVIIKAFFPDVKKGFYVDVGANHPVEDSVTKIFYDAGWSGINIEPLQECIKLLNKYRPRDINEGVGVADSEGRLLLREYKGGGRSTFSEDLKRELEKDQIEPDVQTYREYEVAVVPLKKIFNKHRVLHIHFMKVDVEGLEKEVLISNDWKKYRPELLCIEANHITRDWHDLVKKHGYHKVFDDGLNEYFLAEESLSRRQYFDYPRAMLTGPQIIKWTVEREFNERLVQAAEPLQRQIENTQNELAQKNAHIADLEHRLERLDNLRGSLQNVRLQTKRFVREKLGRHP